MKFINIGPACIRGWVRAAWGWGAWWQKLKQRSKMTQIEIVEFKLVMISTCINEEPIFHYEVWTDVH